MHLEKRDILTPLLVPLLSAWERDKVLIILHHETRNAIPVFEALLEKSDPSDLQILAKEALRKIKTTDPGEW
jgi:hypothetical protein